MTQIQETSYKTSTYIHTFIHTIFSALHNQSIHPLQSPNICPKRKKPLHSSILVRSHLHTAYCLKTELVVVWYVLLSKEGLNPPNSLGVACNFTLRWSIRMLSLVKLANVVAHLLRLFNKLVVDLFVKARLPTQYLNTQPMLKLGQASLL